ncbi:MAG: DNA polymerase III subunit delta [Bacteroidota bacterium]|nr:DNA polymerase III subunit delta [Bacteroidota bacterium]
MRFSKIPGLSNEKKRLVDSFNSNTIHHAMLFVGQRGSANLSLALAFATYINCKSRGDDSCGLCSSCNKMDKLIHPDVNFIFPVAPTTKINKEIISDKFIESWRSSVIESPYLTVEDWFEIYGFENKQPNISKDEVRNLVKKLSLKPFESVFKINIIWLPEYLNISTANAMLKILEEPPGNTLFFIVTNNHQKLISTIRSRVQLFKVKRFSDEDMKEYLSLSQSVSESEVDQAIYLSDGDLNKAEKYLYASNSEDLEKIKVWMRSCYTQNFQEINSQVEWFNSLSKIKKRTFLIYSLKLMREALVSGIDESLSKISDGEMSFISKFRTTLDSDDFEEIIIFLDESIRFLDRNANPKILFLDLSIKISNLFKKVKN